MFYINFRGVFSLSSPAIAAYTLGLVRDYWPAPGRVVVASLAAKRRVEKIPEHTEVLQIMLLLILLLLSVVMQLFNCS